MPRTFDNIDQSLLPSLIETMKVSERADFCVGYFNLRGWKQIDQYVEEWSGLDEKACRLLVGMHQSPDRSIRENLSAVYHENGIDNAKVIELKKELAEEFRTQLSIRRLNLRQAMSIFRGALALILQGHDVTFRQALPIRREFR